MRLAADPRPRMPGLPDARTPGFTDPRTPGGEPRRNKHSPFGFRTFSPMLTALQRHRFDDILEAIMSELPEDLTELMEEVPLIVEDEPSAALLRDLGLNRRNTDLCGLHWGIALTQRSVQHSGNLPDRMMLFRGPILRLAGRRRQELERQVRITLLHEIGHHFGLDEEQLAELGYG